MNIPPDLIFLQWLLDECGYLDVRILPNRRYAAVRQFMFTHAILVGKIGNRIGYDDRWCYADRASAKAAFEAWDGCGEPTGWTRHPITGRRISTDPTERDNDGNAVGAIGVLYHRD